jgi:hypothetical protein
VEVESSANAAQLQFQQQHDEMGNNAIQSMAMPFQTLQEEAVVVGRKEGLTNAAEETCCIYCTFPQNECCLLCSDVSSPREHDLLMASMEGLTHYIMESFHSSQHSLQTQHDYSFLKNRAWTGNSHVGNRPAQATYYYDWVRSIQRVSNVKRVCEIGMNGGHSVIIFLAALSSSQKDSGVHLTMFDLSEFAYSKTAVNYINTLYPGMFTLHAGNSRISVPEWTANVRNGLLCDIFSIDGDHSYEGALIDIKNAAKATKKGGYFILDDVNPGSPTREAFDAALKEGIVEEPRCVENVHFRIGYDNRFDETNARDLTMSWCTAKVV